MLTAGLQQPNPLEVWSSRWGRLVRWCQSSSLTLFSHALLTPCSVHNGFASLWPLNHSQHCARSCSRGAHVVTGCSAPGACVCSPGEGAAAALGLHCCGITISSVRLSQWLQYVMLCLPISQDRGCKRKPCQPGGNECVWGSCHS